jgi:hypothetical protein
VLIEAYPLKEDFKDKKFVYDCENNVFFAFPINTENITIEEIKILNFKKSTTSHSFNENVTKLKIST